MNFDNSANMNHNSNWHSKNECVDISIQISSSDTYGKELPDHECSEVILFNPSQNFFISTTWPKGETAPVWFYCLANQYHTIKGITNTNEVSAKGATATDTLYGRTQSYTGYSLAAG